MSDEPHSAASGRDQSMSAVPVAPMIARLAVQRLAMPGLVNHGAIQASHQRLQRAAIGHELTHKLQARTSESSADPTGTLTWLSQLHAVAADTPEPALLGNTDVKVQSAAAPLLQRAALAEAAGAALTARLLARSTPGLLDDTAGTADPAVSSISDAPGFVAQLRTRDSADAGGLRVNMFKEQAAAGSAPSIAKAHTLVQRVAARDVAQAQRAPAATAAPTAALAGLPGAHGLAIPRAVTPPALAAPATRASLPARASAPLTLARKAASPSAPALTRVASAAPPATGAAPLVLQRMSAAPPPAALSIPVPYPTPATSIAIPSAPTGTTAPSTPGASHAPGSQAGDIDCIVEEVARRLLRRLEIERERKGIRQWR